MAKKKIILFDLDGTLIDSTDAIYNSFCFSCQKNQLQIPSLEEVKKTIGHTSSDMFSHFGASQNKLTSFVDSYREYYLKVFLEQTKILPNAISSVQIANEFARLGIVSTKTSKRSIELLEFFDILKYFEIVIGIEDVQFPKPHKEPILCAKNKIDAKASLLDVFMIGDTPLDAKSAIDAGVHPIGVKCGYGAYEDLYKLCENIFEDSLEAVEFIRTL
ncbi:hypothetical protein BKH42_02200 [Helicobacter sp. 13S00482-2]|uniref:HAD family hydrolase n=1 Tax=Helicobacter sp. 13S00482-2 TaxID=1476200 RepID=UPI000BA6AD89|nr:HAD family hydrolase [Helicobacter sp. 13S00482-2]PAF54045.1 hypothetical protein BKH42_02200 [Helicobacter sp. 13S00482-2]